MGKNKLAQIAVGLVFGVAAMLGTGFIYTQRDYIVEWEWAKVNGKFDPSPDEVLSRAARDFAETKNSGLACVEKWLGKDDKYLFLALGCARFEESLGEVKAHAGDPNFLPTRMRYEGAQVLNMEQPKAKAYRNGLRRLFPLEAAEVLRHKSSVPEFHRLGIARMQEIRGN